MYIHSRASVLETLLTAQTRLVLPTAIHTEDRRERSTQTGAISGGSFLIAAAALKTPTRNGYNAQGVILKVSVYGE